MTMITLHTAKSALTNWLAADMAVAKGQSYSMNGRSLTLADIKEIRTQILYWERKVAALSHTKKHQNFCLADFNS